MDPDKWKDLVLDLGWMVLDGGIQIDISLKMARNCRKWIGIFGNDLRKFKP